MEVMDPAMGPVSGSREGYSSLKTNRVGSSMMRRCKGERKGKETVRNSSHLSNISQTFCRSPYVIRKPVMDYRVIRCKGRSKEAREIYRKRSEEASPCVIAMELTFFPKHRSSHVSDVEDISGERVPRSFTAGRSR